MTDTAKLKAAAEKAKDDFLPNFMVSTRDVLELIAALEAAEKRVAEQAEYVAELEERYSEILRQARSFREAHESASEIIRTLERKKPTVTLPATRLWAGKVPCFEESEIISLLVSAGINLETGGEA